MIGYVLIAFCSLVAGLLFCAVYIFETTSYAEVMFRIVVFTILFPLAYEQLREKLIRRKLFEGEAKAKEQWSFFALSIVLGFLALNSFLGVEFCIRQHHCLPVGGILADAYEIALLLSTIPMCLITIGFAFIGVRVDRTSLQAAAPALLITLLLTTFVGTWLLVFQKAELLAIRGSLYRASGQYYKSIDDLTAAIRLTPLRYEFYRQRSYAYSELELEELRKQDASMSHLLLAREYANKEKEFDEAIHYYEGAETLAASPESKHMVKSEILLLCTKELNRCPKNERARLWRAFTYAELGFGDGAKSDMDVLVRTKPTASSFESRARVLLTLHEYELAVKDAQRALLLSPTNPYLFGLVGRTYIALGDYNKAIEYYSIAIANSDGGYYGAYFSRAQAYEGIGRSDLARKDRLIGVEQERLAMRYSQW